MTLQDIYNAMAYGELRDLFLLGTDIDTGGEGVDLDQLPKLWPNIELGLTVLHTRFMLKEGSLSVPLVADKSIYVLAPKQDVPANWPDDLLKIDRISGMFKEQEFDIPLNEVNNPISIRTSSVNTLVMPDPVTYESWLDSTTTLKIKYRANHVKNKPYLANASPSVVPIYLPATHLEALLLFVASRVMNPIGMVPGALHEGNNYAQKFELAVAQLKDGGFDINQSEENNRIANNGWA
jgi:hypothetical protein